MKVELRIFNFVDYLRFLLLTLNKESSKELDNNFWGYLFKGLRSLFKKNRDYKFAILADGKFAGSAALSYTKEGYEIGYFVLKKYRGKGIATKAARDVLNFGFKELRLRKVLALTDTDNKSSNKILAKTGFKKIRENKKEREFLWKKRR